jgi:hypothetical protein
MGHVKLLLGASILVAGSIAAPAVEMTRPFEVLEQTRRAMAALDARQKREDIERQKQEKQQEARRKREDAEQRKRDRAAKAQEEAQRKRDAAAAKATAGAGAPSTSPPPVPSAAPPRAESGVGVTTVPSPATGQAAAREPPVAELPAVRTQVRAPSAAAPSASPPTSVQADERPVQGRPERGDSRVATSQAQVAPKQDAQSRHSPAAAPNASPGNDAAAPAMDRQTIAVGRLRRMNLYNDRGDKLGDVERVLQSADGNFHIVIGAGGFLGIRERDVRIPLARVTIRGDRLMTTGLTGDEVKTMPVFDRKDRTYRDLARNTTVPIIRDPSGR